MTTGATPTRRQTAVLIATIVVCAAAALLSLGFPARARVYPLTVSLAAVVLGAWDLLLSRKASRRESVDEPVPSGQADRDGAGVARYLGWLAAYYVVIFLVGAIPASGIFVAAFLKVEGRVRLVPAIALGLAVSLGLLGLGVAMGFRWPTTGVDLLL